MDNYIKCPKCGKTITNLGVIDDAANGVGSSLQVTICECGERITYWQITALLRKQKTLGRRFKNWLQARS